MSITSPGPGVARTMGLLVVGYAGYYLCRSHFSATLPLIAAELVAKGADPSATKIRLGDVAAAGTLAYAAGKFVFGGLADRVGGRSTFLLGMAGAVLCTLGFAAGGSLPVFSIAWVANRLLQSMGWPGVVKLAGNWTPPRRHGAALGTLSLSFLFGDAAARALIRRLLEAGLGWRQVFVACAGLLSTWLVLCLLFLREKPEGSTMAEVQGPIDDEPGPGYLGLLRDPGFRLACGVSLGLTIVRETFSTWTPTYFVERVGMSPAEAAGTSAVFPLFGGVSVIVSGVLADRFGRVGRAAILALGLVAAGGAIAGLAWGGSRSMSVGLVAASGFLLMGPYSFLAGAIALDFGGKRAGATASGLIDGVGYLGGIAAGVVVGRLVAYTGWGPAFALLAAVTWASAAVAIGFWAQQRRAERGLT